MGIGWRKHLFTPTHSAVLDCLKPQVRDVGLLPISNSEWFLGPTVKRYCRLQYLHPHTIGSGFFFRMGWVIYLVFSSHDSMILWGVGVLNHRFETLGPGPAGHRAGLATGEGRTSSDPPGDAAVMGGSEIEKRPQKTWRKQHREMEEPSGSLSW